MSTKTAMPPIPPRPNRRIERSISPHRKSYAPSPLNEPTFKTNQGNQSKSSLYSVENANVSASDLTRRPASVTLPSVGQEGNEYAEVCDVPTGSDEEPTLSPSQTRNVANDLKLHAPTPSLPSSSAKERLSTVTRTDSNQAAAFGIGKPSNDDVDPSSRTLKAKASFASNSTERPSSIEGEHGIPEIGQRVPMYPNAGDVQAPSPAPFQTPYTPGIGFHNDGSKPRNHTRRSSARGAFEAPPGSYGLHGHGVVHHDRFEKAYYEKHPELFKKETGQYHGPLGEGRAEWALSSEDLNRIVRDTASRGSGNDKSHMVMGTPSEQIGFQASEEYASRMSSPRPQSGYQIAHSNSSQTHVDSPLRKESLSTEISERAEFEGTLSQSLDAPSDIALESEVEDEDTIHVDDPERYSSKVYGGGRFDSVEDFETHNGADYDSHDEHGYSAPILAPDEVAKEPFGLVLQPAVSPMNERRGSETGYNLRSESASSQNNSRPSSRPGSIHGNIPGINIGSTSTPLEDLAEYEPLFPEDEKAALATKLQGKPLTAADKLKRPELKNRKFPSQDIWEDTPNSLQYTATVSTPQLPADNGDIDRTREDEPPERSFARRQEQLAEIESTTSESFLDHETKQGKPLASADMLKRPELKKKKFPSQDIWEDTPDSLQLQTIVGGPQSEKDILTPPNERPTTGAVTYHQEKLAAGYELAEDEGRATTGIAATMRGPIPTPTKMKPKSPEKTQPTIPDRPNKVKPISQVDDASPPLPTKSKPIVPRRPVKPIKRESAENVPPVIVTSNSSAKSAGSDSAKAKPPVPRPIGSKIAALQGGFMSDLNKRLQLGPQGPKKEEPVPEKQEEQKEKAPLVDARKGRARGPARRAPAKSPAPSAEFASEKQPITLGFSIPSTLWQFDPDEDLLRVSSHEEESPSVSPDEVESKSNAVETGGAAEAIEPSIDAKERLEDTPEEGLPTLIKDELEATEATDEPIISQSTLSPAPTGEDDLIGSASSSKAKASRYIYITFTFNNLQSSIFHFTSPTRLPVFILPFCHNNYGTEVHEEPEETRDSSILPSLLGIYPFYTISTSKHIKMYVFLWLALLGPPGLFALPSEEINPISSKFKTVPDPGMPPMRDFSVLAKESLFEYFDDKMELRSTVFIPGDYRARATSTNGYFGTSLSSAGPFFEKDVNQTNHPGPQSEVTEGWPLYNPRLTFSTISGFYDCQDTPGTNFPELQKQGYDSIISGIPHSLALNLVVGDQVLNSTVDPATIHDYVQTLSFRDGLHSWKYTWTPKNANVSFVIEHRAFTSRVRPNIAATELRVTPRGGNYNASVIDLLDGRSAVRSSLVQKGIEHSSPTIYVANRPDGISYVEAWTASTAKVSNGYVDEASRRIVTETENDNSMTIGQKWDVKLIEDETAVIQKIVSVASTDKFSNAGAEARLLSSLAAKDGWQTLIFEHVQRWNSIMDPSLVTSYREPSTDRLPDCEETIKLFQVAAISDRYNLMQNLASVDTGLNDNGIAVGGLSSDTYGGMIFWDQEVWMYPGIAITDPFEARQILNYRLKLFGQAKANAQTPYVQAKYNFDSRSILLPWTSGRFGNATGTGPVMDYEYHVNTGVALAMLQDRAITGDEAYFRESLWPVVESVAHTSATLLVKEDHGWGIHNMTDPDEYANLVSNGAYTLASICQVLKEAIKIQEEYGLPVNETWIDMANNVNIPRAASGITQEYMEMINNITVKQADVTMLTYPLSLSDNYTLENKVLDKAYYSQKQTPDGPAMTYAINTIIENRVAPSGCAAYTLELQSRLGNLRAPWFQMSEQADDDPNANGGTHPALPFLTGHGGNLQITPFGLLGLSLRQQNLTIQPSLPFPFRHLKIPLFYFQGERFLAAMNSSHTNITRLHHNDISGLGKRFVGMPMPLNIGEPNGRTPRQFYMISENQTLTIDNDMYWQKATTPYNILQCQITQSKADTAPGQYAGAATDGNTGTRWQPLTRDLSSLTVNTGTVQFQKIIQINFDWGARPPMSVRVGFTNSSNAKYLNETSVITVGNIDVSPNQIYGEDDSPHVEVVPYIGNRTEYVIPDTIDAWSGKFAILEMQGCNGCENDGLGATVGEWEVTGTKGVDIQSVMKEQNADERKGTGNAEGEVAPLPVMSDQPP
ncbi:hypothetical protein B7494_g4494 [Chlorociboria aeruginascens]|nr:hypothetical protein B7494_g4494 [Chlorociboria aeruginascens]